MNNTVLSQLIFTRISHDLSGIAGAIYNGSELLEEDISFAQESASLIKTSSENLMARLRFFRQTFGLPKESEDTTKEYLKTFSMHFDIKKGEINNNLTRALIMTLTDYFYRGANFEVASNSIKASGEALKDTQKLKEILFSGKGELSAVNAPAFYAYHLATEKKLSIKIKTEQNVLHIQLDTIKAL